jgi:hypothetical protein
MTTRKPVPLDPAGDPDTRPADNDLNAVTIGARARLRSRAGIRAGADTYHLGVYGLDDTTLYGCLYVEVKQSTGGLEIVADDPEAAEDLAAALMWAASRLRDLRALGKPARDRRTFGLAEAPLPQRPAHSGADPAQDTTTATKEAA